MGPLLVNKQARDLTQEFFARLLAKDYLARVDPQKGKFRSFLLAGLKNLLWDELDKVGRLKRGGGQPELKMTEGAVRVAVHRLRQRFGELFREEVAGTLADPGEIAGEMRHLLAVMSESTGYLFTFGRVTTGLVYLF